MSGRTWKQVWCGLRGHSPDGLRFRIVSGWVGEDYCPRCGQVLWRAQAKKEA
jgi:hypothetical protein